MSVQRMTAHATVALRASVLTAVARAFGVIIYEPGHQMLYPHEPYPNPTPTKFYRWLEMVPADIGYHPRTETR
jgi:hypothetical protein